jgi:hypothetical protein
VPDALEKRRQALLAQYGEPTRLADVEDNVIAFGHRSPEAAEAFAAANRDHFGYPAWTEERGGVWASVVDLRTAIGKEAQSVG